MVGSTEVSLKADFLRLANSHVNELGKQILQPQLKSSDDGSSSQQITTPHERAWEPRSYATPRFLVFKTVRDNKYFLSSSAKLWGNLLHGNR